MDAPRVETTDVGKTVFWEGENGLQLRVGIELKDGRPCLSDVAFDEGAGWRQLAEDLRPEFEIKTGIRRPETRHGQPHEDRWWNYSDQPLTHPEEIRTARPVFSCVEMVEKIDGLRAEILCPGVQMGQFSGAFQVTVYGGSNLIRIEIVAQTEDDSVAYMYRAGLAGFEAWELQWVDLDRKDCRLVPEAGEDDGPVKVRARSRVLTAQLANGAVTCFPPPHSFIWDRQLEINVGFNYYRRAGDRMALGVRHNEETEYPEGQPNPRPWELYNARPGTQQRMSAFYYIHPDGIDTCRKGAMAYVRDEVYKPLDGYQVMVAHFHMGFWEQYRDGGDLCWIDLFKELGINIAHLNDYHGGDGHPKETGLRRLEEQKIYFEACQTHSDERFLIIPGEEPNAHTGGHWDLMLPKPVYYTNYRDEDQPFEEDVPEFGKVYHIGNSEEVLRFLEAEDGIVWTTHPRTKSSVGFPDQMKDTPHFQSKHWIGSSCSYLPADLSFKRLIDDRCELVFDDMNQWCAPKYLIGEVDTYKKESNFDLHGDFIVNYVKVDSTPTFGDWHGVTDAIMNGEFFVTSGEVLISNQAVTDGKMTATVEWTFPLDFVEVVWGSEDGVFREIVSTTDLLPFSEQTFEISVPENAKWVRFATWDCAMNGAFAQPVI